MYARICERSWRLPSLALLAAGSVAMRFAWLRGDLDRLVMTVLPDDAFYYFEIAQRIWAGEGVTFDGVTPATGMHPLWLLAILPFFRHTAPEDVAPLHGVLLLSSLLAAFAAWQLLRFAWRTTQSLLAGAVLAFAFLANYWTVELSLNGLESMLALALVSLFAVCLLDYLGTPTRSRAAWLGVLAGLCILARSDTAVILLFPCALVLWKRRRPWCSHVVLVAFFPALAIVGLSLFNYCLTGRFLQSSASAVPWVAQHDFAIFTPNAGWLAYVKKGLGTTAACVLKSGATMGWFTFAVAHLAIVVIGAREAWRLFRPAPRGSDDTLLRNAAWVILALVAGLFVLEAVHGCLRWIARPYYYSAAAWVSFAGPAVALRMLIPGALDGLASRKWTREGRAVAVLLIAFLAVQLILGAQPHVHYPWQIEMLKTGRELIAGENIAGMPGAKNSLQPGEPVGVFNSGMMAYVNERPIVNLDGVVNEDAIAAIRKRELMAYLQARKIRFLADSPAMWAGQKYFATLAPWFFPDGRPLPHRTLLKIDTPGVGFPTKEDRQEIILVIPQEHAGVAK